MPFTKVDDNVTEKLLRLCYNCDDAHKCDTEEKCLECFNEHANAETEDIDLRESFRLYSF